MGSHSSTDFKICYYCRTIFPSALDFTAHLSSVHSLPAGPQSNIDRETENDPTLHETSLRGYFKVYRLVPGNDQDVDLLNFLVNRFTLIQEKLAGVRLPVKLQLSACVRLGKTNADNVTSDIVDIHANSLSWAIYQEGLTEETFMNMIETMVTTIATYCSAGSGWMLMKINYVDLKFAKFTPLTGSSYLPTPEFLGSARSLINVENTADSDCFIYSYLAARYYDEITAQADPRQKLRLLRNPKNFIPYMDRVRGSFDSPMPIATVGKFEHSIE